MVKELFETQQIDGYLFIYDTGIHRVVIDKTPAR